MSILHAVTFILPDSDPHFSEKLFNILSPFGNNSHGELLFSASGTDFLPRIRFKTGPVHEPEVVFDMSNKSIRLPILNQTLIDKRSPETYTAIDINTFTERIKGVDFLTLDHLGFNLPWFDGVHPDILRLRQKCSSRCAYYRFPTGEEWDFILPATKEELSRDMLDLAKERRPKLEIVSFHKCSTPLIQIDFSTSASFEEICRLFPEGIVDADIRNVWVYIENLYGVDICLVVSEPQTRDWCEFFDGHRLQI